ncbi:elongation of very long chain fatty acids protein AAEL008004-like [Stegodyphus dumicola]|uniref:elongation of very long chain fatty acids protein AAEL008004-like n=1 Tax=Stegodyphus dumicola TaxID=202533 RepID=UPI0015A86B75|nr:elongation of very long chain fatty acids protein AAEL008004-like [Stegodyphus dumicola]XP_035223078.1 elongation of very long chain fatty acids protein AAEL008004-like [Stegodyphus dumicola]XP_035223079.1 elongation of very long chain fatty acids protein AAEL008004-like [Stegodyphus dumicola]
MGFFDEFREAMYDGDPTIREWFLIKSDFWPPFLSFMYLLTIKVIGPYFMKNRKPYDLRKIMALYNLFLVVTYLAALCTFFYNLKDLDTIKLCEISRVSRQDATYTLATCGWVVYLLKYIEFFDTIFFVLRKKDHMITNLHVIHHGSLPLCGWMLFRTERTGIQGFPTMLNSMVHTIMYFYYFLAALGPRIRMYLWWKRYLTILQMTQFIIIFIFATVITPLAGCSSRKSSVYIHIFTAVVFFILFYNFYRHSFKPTKSHQNSNFEKGKE